MENTVQGVGSSGKYSTRQKHFHISQVNGALTDLLFCIGRISSSSSDGSGQMCISK